MFAQAGWRGWMVAGALVVAAALPACAQRASVEQLQDTVATRKAARTSDRALARQLRSLQLTERLTRPTLDAMETRLKLGRQSVLALELLSWSSSFLDPPAGEIQQRPPPDEAEQRAMVDEARNYVITTLRRLPNFFATRTIRSFDDEEEAARDRGTLLHMRPIRTVNQRITYQHGQDTVLEASGRKPVIAVVGPDSGLTSQGEFGPILGTILEDARRGTIAWSHWETVEGGVAAVFRYQVPQTASTYVVDFCCVNSAYEGIPGNSYHGKPAYHGTLTIDPATGAVLRLTLLAELDPSGPLTTSEMSVEYGSVDIGGKSYICPLESVAVARAQIYRGLENRVGTILRLNETAFTRYHRFGSTVRILGN